MQCLGVESGIHGAVQYALKPTLSTSLAAMHACGSSTGKQDVRHCVNSDTNRHGYGGIRGGC